jgi:hypothetical protein
MTRVAPPWSHLRPGLVIGAVVVVALCLMLLLAGEARGKAHGHTFVAGIPMPASGDVSVGFVSLKSTKGDRSKPPRLKIEKAKLLPSNITIFAGVGRATKTVGTYLAPYIVVNRLATGARAAQATPFDVGIGFVGFHRALAGKIHNASNILQSGGAIQQTFLNLCSIRRGDVNFKGAIAYLGGTPVLGFEPGGGGFSAVGFKRDVKKGDCSSAYGKLKDAPGPHCGAKLHAAQVCVAPPATGGGGTTITTTVGPPVISGP